MEFHANAYTFALNDEENAGFSFDLKFNAQFTSLTVIMRERLPATVIISC